MNIRLYKFNKYIFYKIYINDFEVHNKYYDINSIIIIIVELIWYNIIKIYRLIDLIEYISYKDIFIIDLIIYFGIIIKY